MKTMPVFEKIEIKDIPKASIVQFSGGTKITEYYGNKRYKFPFKPAPFHTAFYAMSGLILNVGAYKTVHKLEDDLRSTRRIDVIIVKDIPDDLRDKMAADALDQSDEPKLLKFPTYGWADFMRFEPMLRWMLPPSRKRFCSEDSVLRFLEHGYEISSKEPNMTAPWDIYTYAFENPDKFDVRTLWIGEDFKKKYGVSDEDLNNA